MQFRVVIPDKCQAGQTIRICLPDGTVTNARIPNGLRPGDSFVFELLAADQAQNPQAMIDSTRDKNGAIRLAAAAMTAAAGAAGDDPARHKVPPLSSSSSSCGPNMVATAHCTFRDREVVTCQDFVLALSVGLIIGLAVVIGFWMGVLYVTRDFPPTGYE
jgi:hypothetical protein